MARKPLHIQRPELKSATKLSPLAMNKFAILKAHTVITITPTPTVEDATIRQQ